MLIVFDWNPNASDLRLLSRKNEDSVPIFKSFKFQVDVKGGNEISFWNLKLSTIHPFTPDGINVELKLEDASTTKHLFTMFNITFRSRDDRGVEPVHVQKMHLFKKSSYGVSETKCESRIFVNSLGFLIAKSIRPLQIICNISACSENGLFNYILAAIHSTLFDIEKILNHQPFSDFTIFTDTKQYKVHKKILAAKSEVFSAMLEHDMLEKKENSVSIVHFDDEVIQELLRYMYCGQVENLKKISSSLLEAAAMYLVDGLKSVCLESICENATFDNAVEILLLIIEHKVDYLKPRMVNFIVYNIKYINRVHLQSLNDINLLMEILEKTVKTHL